MLLSLFLVVYFLGFGNKNVLLAMEIEERQRTDFMLSHTPPSISD